MRPPHTKTAGQDEGFMLVGLIVAIFLILLALSVAAPRVAKSLRRDREVEAVHRGNQYVRAVQVYYRKNGHYPGSIEQLEKTNNIRFLRQKYVDPMTGKPDWRLIHVGEAKTTVKGFFGKPLAGLATSAIGSGPTPSTVGTSTGAQGTNPSGSPQLQTGAGQTTAPNSQTGSTNTLSTGGAGSPSTSASTGTATGSSGLGSQSASTFTGGGAPIMGVSSSAPGDAIVVVNEQTTYATWEFIYDPRIEQLKAKNALLGGAAASTSGSTIGTPVAPGAATPNSPAAGTPTTSPSGMAPTVPAPPQ